MATHPPQSEKQDCWWNKGRLHAARVRAEHAAVLEKIQPYQTPKEPGKINNLWALHELNNADKHRLIQVIGIAPNMRFNGFLPGGSNAFFTVSQGALMHEHTVWTSKFMVDGEKVGKVSRVNSRCASSRLG